MGRTGKGWEGLGVAVKPGAQVVANLAAGSLRASRLLSVLPSPSQFLPVLLSPPSPLSSPSPLFSNRCINAEGAEDSRGHGYDDFENQRNIVLVFVTHENSFLIVQQPPSTLV